jgi:L-threonylcarbamoyladenylate synthase
LPAEKGKDIARAKALLQSGKLVGIPTETVYGLAGNAFLPAAVAEIFRVKNRPRFDPLILHFGTIYQLFPLIRSFPEPARILANHFWPGPLTLLLPKSDRVDDLITAGSERVALRIPAHPLSLKLLRDIDFPVAAPSANPFGYISPTRADHVLHQLGDQIEYVLDGGPCQVGVESTILGFEDGQPTVFRKGGISVESLEELIGPVHIRAHSTSDPKAPGMLKSHYAPRVPLFLGNLAELRRKWSGRPYGILSFQTAYPDQPEAWQCVLSSSGDLSEAARNLFASLRHLDQQPVQGILAELLPETGLGRAINDRLKRAAADKTTD